MLVTFVGSEKKSRWGKSKERMEKIQVGGNEKGAEGKTGVRASLVPGILTNLQYIPTQYFF